MPKPDFLDYERFLNQCIDQSYDYLSLFLRSSNINSISPPLTPSPVPPAQAKQPALPNIVLLQLLVAHPLSPIWNQTTYALTAHLTSGKQTRNASDTARIVWQCVPNVCQAVC